MNSRKPLIENDFQSIQSCFLLVVMLATVGLCCTMTGPAGEIYRLKASVPTPSCTATSPQAAIISDLACLTGLTLGNFEPVSLLISNDSGATSH